MLKKVTLSLLLALWLGGALMAQVGVKIPAGTPLGEQAQQVITKKLQQLATLNSVGSADSKACFVLVPQVDILQSEIAPTAPPQQLVKLSIVLMVTETTNAKNILAQTEIASKGVGKNEAAAILNAVQQVDVRSATLKRFMELAKKKMAELPPCEKEAEQAADVAVSDEEQAAQLKKIEVEQCHSDIEFKVLSCTKVGKTFRLTFSLVNNGRNDVKNFWFSYHNQEGIDDEGNKYKIDVLEMSGKKSTELVSRMKVKGELQVKDVDADATEFVQIKLSVGAEGVNLMSNNITLRNVPIILK
jgi:hypothetical protein